MKLKYAYSFQKYDERYLAIVDFIENESERRMLWVNECGKTIMTLLQENMTTDKLIELVKERYSGEDAIIESAVKSFVKQLSEADLLLLP